MKRTLDFVHNILNFTQNNLNFRILQEKKPNLNNNPRVYVNTKQSNFSNTTKKNKNKSHLHKVPS